MNRLIPAVLAVSMPCDRWPGTRCKAGPVTLARESQSTLDRAARKSGRD